MTRTSFASEQLKSLIVRIENLEAEKTALGADIKEVYAEAHGLGFDTKVMRECIKIRKVEAAVRQEREAILDLYLHALGELRDTPLGNAAVERLSREARTETATA